MEKEYDKVADALYIRIRDGKVFKTKEEGLWLIDYDKNNNILGIEILNYSKQAPAQTHVSWAANAYAVCALEMKDSESDEKLVGTENTNQFFKVLTGGEMTNKVRNIEINLLKI